MKISTLEIQIASPVSEVWKALTTNEGMKAWGGSITIDTDWKVGSRFLVTCFDNKGKLAELNGEKMIFDGTIEILNKNTEAKFVYPNKTLGIVSESYLLKKIDEKNTILKWEQVYTNEEYAKGSEDGIKQMANALKKYLEEK